jgi:teichuronic acid exporter
MHERNGAPREALPEADPPSVASAARQALQRLAVLGTGRILARLMLVGAIPLLAQFYDASAFGLFGIYTTAGSTLAAAAALCFERGIVPARADGEGLQLTYFALLMTALTCCALEMVLMIASLIMNHFGVLGALGPLLLLLPVGVALNTTIQVMLQWANRTHRDRVMSTTSVVRSATMLTVQFGASSFAIGANGLIIGQIVGSVAAAVILWFAIPMLPFQRGVALSWRRLLATARSWSALPRFSLPRVILEAGADILNISLMAELFGASDVGFYWMALRVVTIPSQLVDEPLSQVFYRGAAASLARGKGVLRPLVLTMACVAAINIPFIGMVFWGADGIFGKLLGSNWLDAADYAKIMLPGWVAAQLGLPLHIVPILLGRLKLELIAEIGSQAARVLAILAAYAAGSFTLCLALLSAQHVLFALAFGSALYLSNVYRKAAPTPEQRPEA